ncbi:MAG: hypothetical protein ABI217_00270 [Chthoniobacterales bacterium]
MNTDTFDSELASRQTFGFYWVKSIFVEPLLIVAVAAFWLIALPFVAVSLACVKVGDALVAMESNRPARPDALFLRRACTPEGALILRPTSSPARAGRA